MKIGNERPRQVGTIPQLGPGLRRGGCLVGWLPGGVVAWRGGCLAGVGVFALEGRLRRKGRLRRGGDVTGEVTSLLLPCSPAKAGAHSGSPPSRGNRGKVRPLQCCTTPAEAGARLGDGAGVTHCSVTSAFPIGPRPPPGWCFLQLDPQSRCRPSHRRVQRDRQHAPRHQRHPERDTMSQQRGDQQEHR